jgi:aminoglycoside phosphotransferase (APT) family kinase protein
MTDDAQNLDRRCIALLTELGLAGRGEIHAIEPLTGGVASDIAKVVLGNEVYCIKFARAKLKVAEDWQAPIHRSRAEYAWLKVADSVDPGVAPRLFGCSDNLHGFAMEYIEGDGVFLWKAALLAGQKPEGEAGRVADLLGRIHARSSRPEFDRSPFDNRDDFEALRLEPYLRFTATRHPEIGERLTDCADLLYQSGAVLVHGDVSPKNIIFRGGSSVLLDAECATMGDASFDVAFCMNHLILKAAHLPHMRTAYLSASREFWDVYQGHVTWEDSAALGERVSRLIPMLMLARVDGKSPVEYLAPAVADTVRKIALVLIEGPRETVPDTIDLISSMLEGSDDGRD